MWQVLYYEACLDGENDLKKRRKTSLGKVAEKSTQKSPQKAPLVSLSLGSASCADRDKGHRSLSCG